MLSMTDSSVGGKQLREESSTEEGNKCLVNNNNAISISYFPP